jgi:menaquinone-specific isochorismate synthase
MQVRQSVTHSSTDSKSLHDQIVKAIAKAQITGSPILFSYSQNWECSNLLLLLASKTEPKQAKFYWEQPTADLILAGAGSVAEISVPNHNLSDRFACAKQFMKAHLENALIVHHPALRVAKSEIPIHIFGAFSFYHSHNQGSNIDQPDQPAIEFPTLLFFIPRWMVRHGSTGSLTGSLTSCTLTLNHYIQPWDSANEVMESIENMRSHLHESSHYQAPTVHEVSKIIEVEGSQIWTEIVEQALTLINQGHFEKVVLARALDVLADRNFDPFQVLHVLRCEYPECISFLLDCGVGKTFLGATPEVVLQFKMQGDRLWLRSDALAGSIQRGKTVLEDQRLGNYLLNSEKDMREHQFVIRSICDRLQSMGAAIDPQANTGLLRLSNVQHLHTPITAQIDDSDWLIALDILQQLHPTAAVGGEPRDRAVCFMQQWEACDRGWYAAPIGWLNGNGEGTFGVGIRAGYIQGDRARIFAGAGIVANSQVEDEQSETTIKFAALLKALGAMS